MIKNYIFDFGNVIARFDPERLTAQYISDEKTRKCISSIVFDRLYWDRLDLGTITDEEVKEQIKKRVPDELKEISCAVYDNWINNLTPVSGMQELICDIHKSGKKLFVLSNISTGFKNSYHRVDWINELFSLFDGMVFSGEIGMIKPHKEIFEYILTKYNLKREECLFVDDTKINIKGAMEANIKGYLFDGDSEKLREYIEVK